MKKIISIVLVLVMLATVLVSCKKTCDECGEDYSGKGNKIEFDGEKATVCDDCYEVIKPLLDLAEELGGLLG